MHSARVLKVAITILLQDCYFIPITYSVVYNVFKLTLLTMYSVRTKINTFSIRNGEFYRNTKESFHFILIQKKEISSLYTAFTLLSFFLYCIYPFAPFFAKSSSSSSQKAITENREGWKKPVSKQRDIRKHKDQLPPIPHMLSPWMKNGITVDKDKIEWATWNLMRFNEQLSSSQQLPIELAAVPL